MTAIEARFQGTLGDNFVLNVDFQVPARGVTALFGASGCGKTTILRCIAGLEHLQNGRLIVNGQVWQDNAYCLPAYKRAVGYVFQEASLFPHLSVKDNLLYGAKRSANKGQLDFEEVVKLLSLDRLIDRAPVHLSGGERQRVAIGRALLSAPEVLLMDEPLSALDQPSKKAILPYLERLHDELALPVLYVSHDLAEIEQLSDHMIYIEEGKVRAEGALAEMSTRLDLPFHHQDNAGVALDVTVAAHDKKWHLARADFSGGSLWVKDFGTTAGQKLRLRVLASDISISLNRPQKTSILNILSATVEEIAPAAHPSQCLVRLSVGQDALLAKVTARSVNILGLEPGLGVFIQIKAVAVVK